MAWKKLCPGCDKEKDSSQFKRPWKRGKSQLNKYCNECLYPPHQEGRSATIRKSPWQAT